jgi:steroid delta-isomerase-like uncharacterized protein
MKYLVRFSHRCSEALHTGLHYRKDIPMTAQEIANLTWISYDAYNSRASDPGWLDRAAAPIAENCEVVDVPSGMTFRGQEGFKQFLSGFSTAFPDSRVEVTILFATENRAVVEFVGRGTHTGPLQSPAGQIAPTGRAVEVRFRDVYKYRDNQVVSHHIYYDARCMLQQLGVLPCIG